MKTVDEILHEAAQLFAHKNAGYGDAYKKHPKLLFKLLGHVSLKTEADFERFCRVSGILLKLNRYCASFSEGGHLDSAADLVVTAGMLMELAEKELTEQEVNRD